VPEAYVHRIGRTARAGADGTAISFVAGDEMKLLRDIEKVTRQKIPSTDRRNDKSLALLDQSIMASGVKLQGFDARRRPRRSPAAARPAQPAPRRRQAPSTAASRTASASRVTALAAAGVMGAVNATVRTTLTVEPTLVEIVRWPRPNRSTRWRLIAPVRRPTPSARRLRAPKARPSPTASSSAARAAVARPTAARVTPPRPKPGPNLGA
jgi:superfamily II DNA/RNA helicase